jgi:hypothetical protein
MARNEKVAQVAGKAWTVVEKASSYASAKDKEMKLQKTEGFKRLDDLKGGAGGRAIKVRRVHGGFQVMTRG